MEEYAKKCASKTLTKNDKARMRGREKCEGIADCTGYSVKRTQEEMILFS